MNRQTSVIIPMAGDGTRFSSNGFAVPKFKILVKGRPMFHWAISSLEDFIRSGCHMIFVARPEHDPDGFIAEHCRMLGVETFSILHVIERTDGQATTALLAGDLIHCEEDPCLIYNIDTFVEPKFLRASAVRGAGWIPCFPGRGDAWSFARADDCGRVREVREKQRISRHASVGLYWFASFRLYEDCYARHFAEQALGVERYVAPMYNTLIASGHEVCLHELPEEAVSPMGTPAELAAFGGMIASQEVAP